jgi:type II secretory pathway component PulF
MVVDLLFPGTTDIVANLSNLVNQFIDGGLVGLVVFIIVIAIIGRVLYRAYKEFRR